ncbi:YqaJ viral recombinase family protein [Marinobacterium litorale]|uniref:YqaJ viral recombinase family nuclease n=1 Tax=Marinobacterium litorale TaxID=404770 RepID=UPI0004104194|nr:YqaJ viral recombinase family protein [Marinobacterium litorale]
MSQSLSRTPGTTVVPLHKNPASSASQPSTGTRRHGQANRLVDTRPLDRSEWLRVRQSGIGASDAAAAVGLNPYQSKLALWMDKTGRDSEDEPILDGTADSPVYWGNVLEPIVAEHYAKRTGFKVRRVNAVLQHPDRPWMLANLDRQVVGSDEVQILECKTAGLNGAKLWRDGVPHYVQLQVMHQLAVTGQQAADVAVLIAGQELRIYRLERDEALIKRLIHLEHQFWALVESDTPPDADGSESADRALRQLYPQDNHAVVDFTEDLPLARSFAQLQQLRTELEAGHKEEARLKQRLQHAMKEASEALFPTGRITWKRSADRRSVDLEKLKSEHPDWVEQYQRVQPGSRRFLLHAQSTGS